MKFYIVIFIYDTYDNYGENIQGFCSEVVSALNPEEAADKACYFFKEQDVKIGETCEYTVSQIYKLASDENLAQIKE